ncbi:hypothetical protein FS837_000665 [Tulasnella sp. UAMH 9824]|nr:hypothetical protein FS837_000665 [Tulasnella sp. UAMH 9824]
MCFSVAPFIHPLPRLHKFIFDGIVNRKLILRYVIIVGHRRYAIDEWFTSNQANFRSLVPFTLANIPPFPCNFVFSAAPGDPFPELQGPKNDLLLLLALIEYCRDQEDRKITLIHDFDVTFTDANQVVKHKPKTPTSRDVIRSTILQTMEEVGPSGKVFFYFGGHGELVEPEAAMNPSPGTQGNASNDSSAKQTIVVGNNERISGAELRSWFGSGSHPEVPIITMFDTCASGGSLGSGLPYTYDLLQGWVKPRASLHHAVHPPMVSGTVSEASSGE